MKTDTSKEETARDSWESDLPHNSNHYHNAKPVVRDSWESDLPHALRDDSGASKSPLRVVRGPIRPVPTAGTGPAKENMEKKVRREAEKIKQEVKKARNDVERTIRKASQAAEKGAGGVAGPSHLVLLHPRHDLRAPPPPSRDPPLALATPHPVPPRAVRAQV